MTDDFTADEFEEEESEEQRAKREKRRARIEKERAELLKGLAADDFSTLKNRVAVVLNLVPAARDSDIVLCLKYWEMFQPDLYNPLGIRPHDLFKLERLHYIVRVRALIQNDYGLFVASERIRSHRKQNEVTIKADVIAAQPSLQTLKVFADETGKNGKFVIVAAVWVLSSDARFRFVRALSKWRLDSGFGNREMHFTTLGRADALNLEGFLDAALAAGEFLSFKVIAIERSATRRSIAEIVAKLHEHMLKKGVDHEVASGRVSLPRTLEVTLDEEDSLDAIALSEMRSSVLAYLTAVHGADAIDVAPIEKAKSRQSDMLQLADLVAGAVNRLRNHDGERNFKDDYAARIAERLGLAIELGHDEGFDSSTVLALS